MCSAPVLRAVEEAPVGVMGLTARDGTPRAVAVTPYLVDGEATVTTTLALLTKAKMLRNRPAAALYVDGWHLQGDVSLDLHRGPTWFDTHIREAEAEKYPPARSLLAIPFHRRLLWWYVGRVSMTFDAPVATEVPGKNRATITTVVDGVVRITPLSPTLRIDGGEIELGADVPDGPGCLLVHHETDGMEELLSLTLRGDVRDGRLKVEVRRGSLEPTGPGSLEQLRGLRALARSARANRATIDGWETGSAAQRP